MANFKGFKQSTLAAYNALSNDEKKGYMWLVRDLTDTGNTKSAIYFGTRLYAEQNNSEQDLDNVLDNLKTAFGGLLDENGEFVGFPYAGAATKENNPILAEDADDILDILKNIETAILANSAKTETNADEIERIESAITSLTSLISDSDSAVTSLSASTVSIENELANKANADDVYTKGDVDNKVSELEGKISGVWHFKGTADDIDALNALTGVSEGDVYQVGEQEYAWNGSEWVQLGFNVDLSKYATTEYVDGKVENVEDEVSGLTKEVNTLVSNVDTLSGSVESIEEDVENLTEKATTTVDTMEDAEKLAKAENVGQIIYITNNAGDTGYTAGAYIVTGDGSVAKIGTTTATGDLSGAVTALQGDVATLKTDVATLKDEVETTTTGLLDRVEALENDTHTTIDGDDTEE